MTLEFHKYHGTGNDFILIDNRDKRYQLKEENVRFLCNRQLGIGADGLMLLETDSKYDFRMLYYNADGREGSMCGNGGRCITAFAESLGVVNQKANFIAVDGEHISEVIKVSELEWNVKLELNDPEPIKELLNGYFMDTGSPHYVEFRQDVENIDVYYEGKALRHNPVFGETGTNVNFVEEREKGIYVRTYERGVENETLSCGTGVTASALCYARKQQMLQGPLTVYTSGGDLFVHYTFEKAYFHEIILEGPARFVFKGKIEI